jgi:hypothetical protein
MPAPVLERFLRALNRDRELEGFFDAPTSFSYSKYDESPPLSGSDEVSTSFTHSIGSPESIRSVMPITLLNAMRPMQPSGHVDVLRVGGGALQY